MKTTRDQPDDLLVEAKRDVVLPALRRRLAPGRPGAGTEGGHLFRLDEDSFPYVPSRKGRVTSETVYRLQDEE